jgi:DNA-binding winged helix-turn-helix (wHTH) protein
LIGSSGNPQAVLRYRFSHFVVSPSRRLLAREGRELPIIPRYFDLLVLLIERRREAVHKRDIFERVWADVVVSDSALSQAIRTIRRTLGDDSREPQFIRTVSRHGYQFVFPEVIEEEDDPGSPSDAASHVTAGDERTTSTTEPTVAAESPTTRWVVASLAAAGAGVAGGTLGALTLAAIPESHASLDLVPVLGVIGGACAALGGAGVAAGLGVAEASAGSSKGAALVAGGGIGGAVVGTLAQWLGRWSLEALVGVRVPIGGALEGLVIGTAAGLGYALATRFVDDHADAVAVRRRHRLYAVALTTLLCGLGGMAITMTGRPLVGGTVHVIAQAARGSKITLAPLGQLIGEPDFGPLSQAIVGFSEAALFGLGLALGQTRRRPVPAVRP